MRFRAGVLVGGAILAVGCPTEDTGNGESGEPLLGDIAETAQQLQVLLPATGSRSVDFPDPDGWVGYHLLILVDSADEVSTLQAHEAEILGAADAEVLERVLADLLAGNTGTLDADVESAILALGYVTSLYMVQVVIDTGEQEEQIDGDIARPTAP